MIKTMLLIINEYMNIDLDPIEKHKSQIEKRISMLELKFKEKQGQRNPIKKTRQYLNDENKNYHPQIRGSKTMELRGKIKAQGDIFKPHKDPVFHPTTIRQPLRQTGVTKMIKQQKQSHKDPKDQKIQDLQSMIKQILEGQKTIQKELDDIKKQQQNEKKRSNSFIKEQYSALDSSIDKVVATSKEKNLDKSNRKTSINQSILIKENIQSKEGKSTKQRKIKQKKQFDFESHLQDLRNRGKDGERVQVSEEWKTRVWAEVQGRVKQSEKQYKDTIHRNIKHQYDHLISTFELQRKLKDDLLDKVYEQCNKQIYK